MVDQGLQGLQGIALDGARGGGDGDGGFDGAAEAKTARRRKTACSGAEQVVAPGDRLAQGLMTPPGGHGDRR